MYCMSLARSCTAKSRVWRVERLCKPLLLLLGICFPSKWFGWLLYEYSIHLSTSTSLLVTACRRVWLKGPHTLHTELQKNAYLPYTLKLLFTNATIFLPVLYMNNDFHNDFFRKNLCSFVCSVRGP